MSTIQITDADFTTEVFQSDIPVLVDFGTEWCAPCKQLEPVLDEIAAEMAGRVKIVKVDLDKDPDTATRLGVRGMPSLFLFRGENVIANKTGAAPKAALRQWIDSAL